ncbi:MAG TPA: sensor histidine kinase [Paenibacillaceae bacterium]|nr:sensor histidine kinase [Paenibacillaceae bacterium]
MKGYMENPELKKSSLVFLLIMVSFLLSNYLMIKANNEHLKEDYINVFGSITAKVVENHPELEKEIVPLLAREVTVEEAQKGREILRQYGLTEQLDNQLFPYIKDTFMENETGILLSGLLLTILLFIFNYVQYGYFYRNIRAFSSAAKKIVEGNYNLKLGEEKEGDLSKLTRSFNSMGGVIRANILQLKKEKVFLVDLLSDISHQLKTPLSSMIVYNDIMLSKDLPREQQLPFLESNQKQLERMEWLIKSLLKLARLDAQAIKFGKKNQSITKTIEESIKAIQNKAQENKVILEFNQRKEIFLEHDRPWLKEALINIIGNSIEHSPWGEKVNIKLIENPIYKRITIEDRGEGIGEEDLPNIFKRFYRAKTFQKRDSVGIGLALAKAIIEGHGGFIEAQSQLGEGTKFMITFLKY